MYDRPGCCVAACQAENFVPKRDNAPKNEANLVGDTTVFIEEIPVQKSPQIDPEKCTGYLQREMAYSHETLGPSALQIPASRSLTSNMKAAKCLTAARNALTPSA